MKLEVQAEPVRLELQRMQLIETDDGVVIKRGRVAIRIEGDEAAEVVRSVLALAARAPVSREEICEQFLERDRPQIEELLRGLEARHILTPVGDTPAGPPPDAAETPLDVFYWHFNKRTSDVREHLSRATIAVVGVNEVSRQLVRSLLAGGAENVTVVDYPLLCNVRLFADDGSLSPDQWPSPLPAPVRYREWADTVDAGALGCLVATSDFGGQQLMRQWNRYCVTHGCHFLPVVLQDLIGYVGPLVIPGESACLECTRARQNSHMDNPSMTRLLEHVAFEGQGVNAFHPAMASILGDITAMELTKFYGGFMPPDRLGRLIEVNLLRPELTEHRVLKLPRCEVCSELRRRSPVSYERNAFVPGHPVTV